MKVIFEATIKENGIGGWFIQLKDTVDGRVENCNDLEEFSITIEKLGSDYGGHIDEVKWSVDENVSPNHLTEVKAKMAKYHKELFDDSND
ncbi:hypothetical protein CP960_06870 [Malaciobacter halophilus]|uniref:Uncharacterized protein n=1 Tax=Malaciobacter halophilus TaxID=197482 RepID=A0A2N1J370_9BACT|nr:hypothetical protein [Malaciobacter halophilus]AXH10602.1 hypothetical protein AHALO_2272 [Malaciobacter halophilus]PKI80954.1 hypothetical protein CP960_06870 [Malaciobacter halophilus]